MAGHDRFRNSCSLSLNILIQTAGKAWNILFRETLKVETVTNELTEIVN